MRGFKEMEKDLDQVSPSLCLAKWLYLSLHLDHGTGHSCHHPKEQSIPTHNLLEQPALLHNTAEKRQERLAMMLGQKPSGCEFCWRAESKGNFGTAPSDRIIKSASPWAAPYLNEVVQDFDKDWNPTYLEVSFSNQCQMKCCYCGPHYSSAWQAEIAKYGNQTGRQFPKASSDSKDKIYLEAFWKWWPELSQKLKILRVTGGEPLLSKDTENLFNLLEAAPRPQLDLIVNSNLSVDTQLVKNFSKRIQTLTSNKIVKKISVITSMEAVGRAAEYIRFGLKNELFWSHLEIILCENPNMDLSITSTVQVLSADSFIDFLKELLVFRARHGFGRLTFDPSPLQHPEFLSIEYLPESLKSNFKIQLLDFLTSHKDQLSDYEKIRILALIDILKIAAPDSVVKTKQIQFVKYFSNYDKVRKTDFRQTFPNLVGYWNEASELAIEPFASPTAT